MGKRLFLMMCAFALAVAPVKAQAPEEGMEPPMEPPPFPHLVIPLSPDFEPPPPEEGPEAFVEAAVDAVDRDHNGLLSVEEIGEALAAAHEHRPMPPEGGEMPPPPEEGAMPPPPEGDEMPPPPAPMPFPHLMIPLVPDFVSPEEGPEAFVEAAVDFIDEDGDGQLSAEEVQAAIAEAREHLGEMGMPPEGDMDHGGTMEGETWEEAECNSALGNQVIRELTATPGANAVAISLPEGREAGCFSLEVKGAEVEDLDFEMQIIEETDPPSDPPPVMWHSDDGKEAYESLVLEGEGIYHLEVLSSGVESAVFVVSYVDYPAGE